MKSTKTQDKAILLLINGRSYESAIAYFINNKKLDKDSAKKIVNEARKKITLASDYVRDEKLAKAIDRIEVFLLQSAEERDYKTALQAQKELNKLLGLYTSNNTDNSASNATSEAEKKLTLISEYILPLNLTEEAYPIEEHVRIAAEKIRQQAAI